MRHLSSAALSLLLLPLLASTQTKPAPSVADLYAQAFATIDWTADDQSPVVDNALDGPLLPETAAYLDAHQPLITLLKQAAAATPDQPAMSPADHAKAFQSLNDARHAANILTVQARFDASQGHPEIALESLLAQVALARHIGSDKVLMDRLIALGIESQATTTLAHLLPSLPRPALSLATKTLATFPPSPSFAESIKAERDYLPGPNDPNPLPPAASRALATQLAPFYRDILAAADRPPEDFSQACQAAAARSNSPAATALAKSFAPLRLPLAKFEAQSAMLQTALSILLTGPAALQNSSDPFAPGHPFTSTFTPQGFTLSSHLTINSQPVTLQVGP